MHIQSPSFWATGSKSIGAAAYCERYAPLVPAMRNAKGRDSLMLRSYCYLVEALHVSCRRFRDQFVVVAADDTEAAAELAACMNYWDEVKEWKVLELIDVEPVSETDGFGTHYQEVGAFTIYGTERNVIDTPPAG